MRTVFFFILILFFVDTPALAQSSSCQSKKDTGKEFVVVFVNGINNSDQEACFSAIGLNKKLVANGISENYFDYQNSYNPSQGMQPDIDELMLQARISDQALARVREDASIRQTGFNNRYYFALGQHYVTEAEKKHLSSIKEAVYSSTLDLYNLLKNLVTRQKKKVVVVAHSQGNYLAEAAYAMMLYRGEKSLAEHIRFVGVGVVATSTPNNSYVTLEQDLAVGLHGEQTIGLKYFSPLVANVDACVSKLLQNTCEAKDVPADKETYSHNFLGIYLNPYIIDKKTKVSVGTMIATKVREALKALDLVPVYAEVAAVPKSQASSTLPLTTKKNPADFRVLMVSRVIGTYQAYFQIQTEDRSAIQEYSWSGGKYKGVTPLLPGTYTSIKFFEAGESDMTLTITMKSGAKYTCTKDLYFGPDVSKETLGRAQCR